MNAPTNLRIVIVRHGQTDWNIAHRFQGQTDVPLNAAGETQAGAAGRAIRSAYPGPIQAIYTSDLLRARRTAEIIQGCLQPPDQELPPIFQEPRLREMNFGEWEGLTYTEIQQRNPDALKRWEADLERHAPPGGETMRQLAERVAGAQADILAAHSSGTLALVSHGGPLQLWIALALGLPPGRFWQLHLSNASISEISVYPEGAIVNLLNSRAHLD